MDKAHINGEYFIRILYHCNLIIDIDAGTSYFEELSVTLVEKSDALFLKLNNCGVKLFARCDTINVFMAQN